MLVQLVFASVATQPCSQTQEAILQQARKHNADSAITGALCYGYGIYLGAMEGERSQINRIYAEVLRDERHAHAQLLYFSEISERTFAHWPLGRVNLESLNPSAILKYIPQWPPQPEHWTAVSAVAFLKDMVASASVVAR